jgi:hypothetical protein
MVVAQLADKLVAQQLVKLIDRLLAFVEAHGNVDDPEERTAFSRHLTAQQWNELRELEGGVIGLLLYVAGGTIPFNPPRSGSCSARSYSPTGIPIVWVDNPELEEVDEGIELTWIWRDRMRSLRAIVQAIADMPVPSEGTGSERADKSADAPGEKLEIRDLTPDEEKLLVQIDNALAKGEAQNLKSEKAVEELAAKLQIKPESVLRKGRFYRLMKRLYQEAQG